MELLEIETNLEHMNKILILLLYLLYVSFANANNFDTIKTKVDYVIDPFELYKDSIIFLSKKDTIKDSSNNYTVGKLIWDPIFNPYNKLKFGKWLNYNSEGNLISEDEYMVCSQTYCSPIAPIPVYYSNVICKSFFFKKIIAKYEYDRLLVLGPTSCSKNEGIIFYVPINNSWSFYNKKGKQIKFDKANQNLVKDIKLSNSP
ncbi:MAG TPA: hypothetical protein PLS10_08345 [Chitinophagales bacterium]|nr:hypothetical protein [Chitinophagales bacterium]